MVTFRERLQKVSGVKHATFSNTGTTSSNTWGGMAKGRLNGELIEQYVQVKLIDPDYFRTYDVKLVAGRSLVDSDTVKRFLLNEEAVRQMGYLSPEDAIGIQINIWDDQKGEVVGVVKDFYTMSLHHSIQPVAFFKGPEMSYRGAVKLEGNDLDQTIKEIEDVWKSYFTEHIFSYNYLDESIVRFYTEEKRLANTFGVFSLIAILIGSIGLLGLISYMVNVKMKEIGIRKDLGASIYLILKVISSDFVILTFLSFLFALPVTWYLVNSWLQNFESRIELNPWIFIAALGVSLVVTVLTVSFQSVKAAMVNPVNTLKDD